MFVGGRAGGRRAGRLITRACRSAGPREGLAVAARAGKVTARLVRSHPCDYEPGGVSGAVQGRKEEGKNEIT